MGATPRPSGGQLMVRESFGIEPIIAWRAWDIKKRRSLAYLASPMTGDLWMPGRWYVTTCTVSRTKQHDVPVPRCTCGIYAVPSQRDPPSTRSLGRS